MDKLNHPLARGASYLLIYLTAFQPLHPAFAAGITAANGNTQVVIKPGNVPVVNIATPNGAGISHNSYKDFNVAAPGAVLNNATAAGQSQLAGQLNANGNLKGKAAELIINEVTGGRRSELQGKLEVFGNKANVMIANPNGITCDGCGFINAPGVTLTTGKPQFDKQGALEALEVKKGSVIIGSKGLDGYSADYVDILSRATEVNGQINANNLSLTQGANRVSFKDGTVTPIAGEGAKPQLAVDTKALGGMYANKIRLVANEDGVGVNLRDIITNQRDITLSAKGKMTLGGTFRSKTDLNVSANELLVAPWSTVQADQDVTLASPALTNAWQVTASGDIRVFSDTVRNVGADAKIHANNNLWIQKDAQGNKANLVENRSATIKTNSGDLVIRTENLENTVDTLTPSVTVVTPQQGVISQNELGWHMTYSGGMGQGVAHVNAIFDQGEPNAWFGNVDFNTLSVLPVSRQVYTVSASKSPVINSGHNLFINATSLHNLIGDIHSANDMVLTGNNFSNESRMTGILGHYYLYPRPPMADNLRPNPAPNNSGGTGIYHIRETIKFKRSGEAMAWAQGETLNSTVTAGGNLVADFHDTINIDTPLLYSPDQVQEVSVLPRGDSLTAHNIVLRANNIIATDNIRSATDITLQADNQVRLGQAQLLAARETSVVAGQDISFWLSRLQGTQVNLVSRNGDIRGSSAAPARYYRPDGSAALANITANDLTMNAGKNIDINATELHVGWNIAGLAGKSLLFLNNDHLLTPSSLVAPGSQEYR